MVKDIIDIVGAIRDLTKNGSHPLLDPSTTPKMLITPKKSITRLAMDAVATFPVILEDLLTLDEGIMIARSLEKQFASFLMIIMSMDPTFNLKNGATLTDYVRQFHQNMNVDDAQTAKFSMESVENFLLLAESKGKEYNMFLDEATLVLHTIYEGVKSKGIDKAGTDLNFTIEEVTEADVLNDIGKTFRGDRLQKGTYGNTKRIEPKSFDPRVDVEFKKANDSVPTLVHVRVFQRSGSDISGEPIDFIIGVKAQLHPTSQMDIMLNLIRGLKNDDRFFNMMRWTTGEIKFFKDFLFCVDQLKLEAITSSGSSNTFFNMGRRRKELASIKNRFTKNDLLPNMTVVVTTDCLNRIKDEYGYDITPAAGTSQTALIRKLMSTYFMLGFVIVDPGLARVDFLFDGKTNFETYTYTSLQREGTANDRQFKEMMKMLGRSA